MSANLFDPTAAREANGFPEPTESGMPPEAESWVLDVYAPALKIIADCFRQATGRNSDDGSRFAGVALAKLAQHDPPIGVELIR